MSAVRFGWWTFAISDGEPWRIGTLHLQEYDEGAVQSACRWLEARLELRRLDRADRLQRMAEMRATLRRDETVEIETSSGHTLAVRIIPVEIPALDALREADKS